MLTPEEMQRITPMMKQYFAIKAEHEDHILFYRLGDFYEMFFDDAVKRSPGMTCDGSASLISLHISMYGNYLS